MLFEVTESELYTTPCYRLYNCLDLSEIYTGTNLSAYVDGFVYLEDEFGCWYVTESAPCQNPESVTVIFDECSMCSLKCYTIGGFGTVSYVTAESEFLTAQAPIRLCSYIPPRVSGSVNNYIVIDEGECGETGCPPLCFLLTNCETEETKISNSQSLLSAYAFGQTVTLAGFNGCWQVTASETCDCAISVNLQLVYDDCESCLPITAYRLSNCLNPSNIIYSVQPNLSTHVGKTVQIECGVEESFCWNVTLIDYQPPVDPQVVDILNSFENCYECSRTYYKLTDCEDELDPVYTYFNLSSFLDKVIKINDCPTCWTVEVTTEHLNATNITVAASFTNCITCGVIETCTCTRITNYATGVRNYTYIDCSGIVQNFSLDPKETKKKFCVGRWITRYPTTDNLEEFGNCIDGDNAKICPPDPTGRQVRPGYTTPSCNPEQFENITCRASEILYKTVLQQRYGISNCCPEEDDKWLIKKELIDLAALEDSNYICTVVNPCCAPSTCGCSSCNS